MTRIQTSTKASAGVIALGLALSIPAFAQLPGQKVPAGEIKSGAYTIDKTHAAINWHVNHLGFSTYQGRFEEFDAALNYNADDPTESALSVTIPVENVDSGVAELDEHLQSDDFFNAAEYPEITFEATDIEITGDGSGKITGDLSMHGVTKPVTLDAELVGAGTHPVNEKYVVGFSGTTTIKRSEWGMDSYTPAVGDDITLEISAEFFHSGE